MTVAPFTPKAETPQWKLIYDELCRLDVGDLLTYDRLNGVLGYDFRKNRSPLYKAARVWGIERSRAIAPVNGQGYRVVDASEHELLARAHHRRSKRALRRGRQVLASADRNRLSEQDRARFEAMEANLARQEAFIRRLDARITKVERAIAESTRRPDPETAARLARLEEALQRHGIASDYAKETDSV